MVWLSNLRRVCPECSKKLQKKDIPYLDIKVSDYVKICRDKEHFWVKVTHIDMEADHEFMGIIDNDLVLTELHGLKYKDTVSFSMADIEDYQEDFS